MEGEGRKEGFIGGYCFIGKERREKKKKKKEGVLLSRADWPHLLELSLEASWLLGYLVKALPARAREAGQEPAVPSFVRSPG